MLVVRPITPADFDAVATVRVRGWQEGYAGIVPADHLAGLNPATGAKHLRTREVRPDQHTLVADEDGRIVGFASFGPYRRDDDSYDEGVGELYAIYVSPADWGRGFGSELLVAARTALAGAGYPAMRLWVLEENDRARRFYERMGLAPDGTRQSYTPRGTAAQLPELRYAAPL